MKINGNEIRPGNVIEHNNSLWVAVKTQAVKPGKGPAYNQVELKNLINGSKLNERFQVLRDGRESSPGAEGFPVPLHAGRHARVHGYGHL